MIETEVVPHPAKFGQRHLHLIVDILGDNPELNVLDPFAGVGTIHQLPYFTRGVELEPEWADQHPQTVVGDALKTEFDDACFDAVVTSPCFGNRMADNFEAKDDSIRHTYRQYLGRTPTDGSSAVLQWGDEYRNFHKKAWVEAKRVLVPHGKLVINIKNHVRAGQIQKVTEWHVEACREIGFQLTDRIQVPLPGLRHGENHEKRLPHETLLVFIKAPIV